MGSIKYKELLAISKQLSRTLHKLQLHWYNTVQQIRQKV